MLIHKSAIQQFGGEPGHFHNTLDRIESVLDQQHPHFDYDKYPTVFDKAAMLMYFFTKDHCFVDGNKRVGVQSAIVFLTINGYKDILDDKEGYIKTLEVESAKVSEDERDLYIENLADWLSHRFI